MATVDRFSTSVHRDAHVIPIRRPIPLQKRIGRVFVTGANGFVGSNAIVSLKELGAEAIAGVRMQKKLPQELAARTREVEYRDYSLNADFDLRKVLAGVDTIVHSAGAVAASSYRKYCEVNARGTHRLLEAASRMPNPPRFILISSLAAAGPSPQEGSRTAEDPPAPVSLYGRSKLLGEHIAARYSGKLPITILRPGIVFGPGDREVLRLIKLIAATRINFIPGRHRPRFPFVYVQDLVDCIVQAIDIGQRLPTWDPETAESDRGEGIYFVADSQSASFAQFGKWISNSLGQRWSVTVPIPIRTLRNAAWVNQTFLMDERKPSTFSVDKIREAAQMSWECDVSKTQMELDWVPQKLLEERVHETIQWYRQHRWL